MPNSEQITGTKSVSTLVRCDHCWELVSEEDAVPYKWKYIKPDKPHTWYYCIDCHNTLKGDK